MDFFRQMKSLEQLIAIELNTHPFLDLATDDDL